jgi:Protein tyrosine and serine/threonine kinase
MTAGVGTTAYMAPEIATSTVYDESADVYSFAIVLWEVMLSRMAGGKPYHDIAPLYVIDRVAEGVRPPVRFDPTHESVLRALSTDEIALSYAIIDLLTDMWAPRSAARPSFESLYRSFVALKHAYRELFDDNPLMPELSDAEMDARRDAREAAKTGAAQAEKDAMAASVALARLEAAAAADDDDDDEYDESGGDEADHASECALVAERALDISDIVALRRRRESGCANVLDKSLRALRKQESAEKMAHERWKLFDDGVDIPAPRARAPSNSSSSPAAIAGQESRLARLFSLSRITPDVMPIGFRQRANRLLPVKDDDDNGKGETVATSVSVPCVAEATPVAVGAAGAGEVSSRQKSLTSARDFFKKLKKGKRRSANHSSSGSSGGKDKRKSTAATTMSHRPSLPRDISPTPVADNDDDDGGGGGDGNSNIDDGGDSLTDSFTSSSSSLTVTADDSSPRASKAELREWRLDSTARLSALNLKAIHAREQQDVQASPGDSDASAGADFELGTTAIEPSRSNSGGSSVEPTESPSFEAAANTSSTGTSGQSTNAVASPSSSGDDVRIGAQQQETAPLWKQALLESERERTGDSDLQFEVNYEGDW